jgi:hypothetical protein
MKLINSLPKTLFCASLLALAAGCAHVMPVAVNLTALPPGEKLPVKAALVLNKDFTEFKHQYGMMGDTFVFPFGAPLKDYALHVAGASFQEVQTASSVEQALQNPSTQVLLIPKAVKADQSMGVWAASKENLTLVIEWIAKDRASQNTIWLKTITADASETEGNVFSAKSHQKILVQKLFDDLSLKTYQAFQHAPEFRNLAQ